MPERHRIDYMSFDHEIPADRDQAPDFTDLSLSVGPLQDYQHGGHTFLQSSVFVSGTLFDKLKPGDKDTKSQVQVVRSEKIGKAFIKKNGSYSFEPALMNAWSKGYVRRLYTKYKGENSQDTLDTLAKSVGIAVTRRNQDQFSSSMRERIPVWLMEEGVAERLALSLIDLLKIAEVMNA
jgi:hypothetical protein